MESVNQETKDESRETGEGEPINDQPSTINSPRTFKPSNF